MTVQDFIVKLLDARMSDEVYVKLENGTTKPIEHIGIDRPYLCAGHVILEMDE